MAQGSILVTIIDEQQQPITDASLSIYCGDQCIDDTICSQKSEHQILFSLDAPHPSYTLHPQPSLRPYALYTLICKHPLYHTEQIVDIPIFANQHSTLHLQLKPNFKEAPKIYTTKIDEHRLYKEGDDDA